MVVLIEGVVNEFVPVPPANGLPPAAAAYQSVVSPAPGVAEIATVPVPHLAPFVPVGRAGTLFTVAVTGLLVAEIHVVVVFLASA